MEKSAELARFSSYPYRLLPGDQVTVWAGYQEMKARLLHVVESARMDRVGLYQFGVLHGELGTGKSHAMRYLLNEITVRQADDFKSVAVYLPRIAVAAKTDFLALYRAIADEMRPQLQRIGTHLDEQLSNLAHTRREASGAAWAEQGAFRETVIQEVGQRDSDILAALLAMGTDKEPAAFRSLAGESKGGLVETDFDAVRALGAIVRFATKAVGEDEPPAKCVYLFLDEIEAIGDFSSAQAVSINTGIRDTLNAAPEGLCMLLGFTGDAAFLEGLFDRSVISRMTTEPIELPALDLEQSLAFIRDIHSAYRDPDAQVDKDFPFSEEALREVISRTSERTPRLLMRGCRTALEQAVVKGVFDGTSPIPLDFVEDVLI